MATNQPKDNSLENAKIDIPKDLSTELEKISDLLKHIDSGKDSAKKKKTVNLSKVYDYWVIIQKDGRFVKDFGVKSEEYDDIKLLIRRENINGEEKVVFKDLYPEPKFDTNVIYANRNKIRADLNKLKQIEDELEKNMYSQDGQMKEYNFDISDVRILILQKEIELHSIQYGKSFRYAHQLREDGIPVLIYELENSGLRLKKEVKESYLFVEASENKRIESKSSGRQIDEVLSKKANQRDWKKIAWGFIWLLATIGYVYGAFAWVTYNEERAFEQCNTRFDQLMNTVATSTSNIVNEQNKRDAAQGKFMTDILNKNTEILDQCIAPPSSATAKPVYS